MGVTTSKTEIGFFQICASQGGSSHEQDLGFTAREEEGYEQDINSPESDMKALTDQDSCGLECTRLTQALRQTENLSGKGWLSSPGNAATDCTTGFITPVLCALLLGDVPLPFSYLFQTVQFTLSYPLAFFSCNCPRQNCSHCAFRGPV